MTKDLAVLIHGEKKFLTTSQFLEAIDSKPSIKIKLKKYLIINIFNFI